MSSLFWCKLVSDFYRFRSDADKIGFYSPELDRMEQSLLDIRPAPLTLKDIHVEKEEIEDESI